jgi:hypothetical protein
MLATKSDTVLAKLIVSNTTTSDASDINSVNKDYSLSEKDITFVYDINKDGTLTITGLSDMTKELLYSNNKMFIDNLIIPASLTIDGKSYQVSTIGEDALILNKKANSVVLQEGISHIMGYFMTAHVKSIIFPSTLKEIDTGAFTYFSTKKIMLSGNNPYFILENNILYSKDGTTLVWAPLAKGTFTIPKHATKISGGAFVSNLLLKKVVMHDEIDYIGDYAFYECEHLNVIFPEKLDFIGERAFMYTSLNELKELPKAEKIGAYAFYQTKLTQIILPEGVSDIGEGAFAACSHVTKLNIPASLKIIGMSAFQFNGRFDDGYDSKLNSKYITINKNNKYFSVRNGCLCNKAGTKLIQVLSPVETFTVPSSVINICEEAMSHNHTVKKVIFNNKCKVIPKNCLEDCPQLSTVIIPASVIEIKENALESIPGDVIRTIIFKGKTPPSIYRNLSLAYNSLNDVYAYDDSFQLLCIKVPKGCQAKYKTAFEKVKFVYSKLEEE